MLLKNKNITVVGAGCTGVATSNFLVSKEASVVLVDIKSRVELEKNLLSLSPRVRTLFECSEIPESSDLIVLSPGVNINASFLEESRRRGIQIISEIELAFRFTKTPIIAVTGTNGKSTVTTLIGDILKQAGKKIAVGGNLGTPFVALLEQDPVDYFVLEISTFQLEGIKTFRPNIAVILNITPDHLDRHKTLEEYADLKGRVSAFQNDGDMLVLNKDDENVMKQGKRSKAKKFFFSLLGKVDRGAYLEDGFMFICSDGSAKNQADCLAAGECSIAAGNESEAVCLALMNDADPPANAGATWTPFNYTWDFGDGSTLNDTISRFLHTYNDTGHYKVNLAVSNEFGCVDTIAYTIIIDPIFIIYIPNAFTPNGDNINDTFGPSVYGISEFEMKIYNRWGQIIYHTT